jgi:hypothetical protein
MKHNKKIVLATIMALSLYGAVRVALATTYEKPNRAGGQIVLSERQGSCDKGMLAAYTTSKDGDVQFGCWGFNDGRVFLIVNDQVVVHEPSSFTKKNETAASKPATVKGM